MAVVGLECLQRDVIAGIDREVRARALGLYAVLGIDTADFARQRVRLQFTTWPSTLELRDAVARAERGEQPVHVLDFGRLVRGVADRRHHAAAAAHPALERSHFVFGERMVRCEHAAVAVERHVDAYSTTITWNGASSSSVKV